MNSPVTPSSSFNHPSSSYDRVERIIALRGELDELLLPQGISSPINPTFLQHPSRTLVALTTLLEATGIEDLPLEVRADIIRIGSVLLAANAHGVHSTASVQSAVHRRFESFYHALVAIDEAFFVPLRTALHDGTLSPHQFIQVLDSHSPANSPLGLRLLYDGRDVCFDRLLAIPPQTRCDTSPRSAHMSGYGPTPLGNLLGLLRWFQLKSSDRICDLGGGLARPSIFFALASPASCISVEFSESLHQNAAEIVQRNHISKVELVCGDVRAFDFNRANIFYLFQPFRGRIMEDVTSQLRKRIERAQEDGTTVTIITLGRECSSHLARALSDCAAPYPHPIDPRGDPLTRLQLLCSLNRR